MPLNSRRRLGHFAKRTTLGAAALTTAISLILFVSVAPAQPQGKGKGKGKAKARPQPVKTTVIAEGLDHPWSMAWLPDGDILVTERSGHLRRIHDGKLLPDPVPGVPAVHAVRLSGLMSVFLHPDFAQNHYIYLTYTRDIDKDTGAVATTLARGRYEDGEIVGMRDILVCDTWPGNGGSGARALFGPDGMIYMTTGASNGEAAQDPLSLRGKILRLTDDGSPAPGNPFEGMPSHRPEIYSMGHRNSLGLAFNPYTGELWNNENGPYGGDEVNRIRPGGNYGWPYVSFGTDYANSTEDNPPLTIYRDGMIEPVIHWNPSIAVSGMLFYNGDKFPAFDRNLFVGGMLGGAIQGVGHLERIILDDNWNETGRQTLLADLGERIRDVEQGPDGYIYVLTDENDGKLIRLEPVR